MDELVVQQGCDLEGSGLEGVDLRVGVLGVEGVEVNLGQVAVEVLADDLAAGVEAVTHQAVIELLFLLVLVHLRTVDVDQ